MSTHMGLWMLRGYAVPMRAHPRLPSSPHTHRFLACGVIRRSRAGKRWGVACSAVPWRPARVSAYSVDTAELGEQCISGQVVSVVGGRFAVPRDAQQQRISLDCVAAQLRQTGCLAEVAEVLGAARGCLTCEAVAQALFTIAYHKKQTARGVGKDTEGERGEEALLEELEGYVTGVELEFTPRAVANMMRTFCDLRRLRGDVREALEAYCLVHVERFRSNEIAKVLYACASAGQVDTPLFRALEGRIQHVAAFFTPMEVALLAWSYASSGNRSKSVFTALRAQLPRAAPAMNAQDVTTTLWAFAAAGYAARPVLNILRPVVLTNLGAFNQQDIGTTARAFSYASCLDTRLCAALTAHALRQADRLSPHSMAALAGAFGQVGFVSEPLCHAIEAAVLRDPSAFRTLDLQQILGGFLAVGVTLSARLGETVKGELAKRVGRMSCRKLADTLVAFKTCNLDSSELREVISAEVTSRAPSMSPADMSTCLEAFSRLGPVPTSVLDCVEREAIRRSLRFTPPLMLKVLGTLVRAGRRATPLFSAFEGQVVKGADDLCPRDASTLMAVYAAAGKGSPSLYSALSTCVAGGASELPPKVLQGALEALRVAKAPVGEARLLKAARPSVVHRAEDCSLRQLAFFVEAYAMAGISASDVCAAAAQQASARADTCDPNAACRLLKAFRAAEYRPAASLLLQLQPMLVKAAPTMRPPALSGALRSYAALGVRAPELFSIAPALLLPKLAHLQPVQAAYLAWAFVTVGEARDPGVQALLGAMEDELVLGGAQFGRPAPVIALLWAYASAGRLSSRLFDALAPVVVTGADRLAAREVVRVLWAYAVAECDVEVKLEVFSALEPAVHVQAGELDPDELASVVWAFTSLGYDSVALFDTARQRIMSDALAAPSFEADALEAGVWAMTALHDYENGGYIPTTPVSRLTVSMEASPSPTSSLTSLSMEEEDEGEDPWAAYEQHCVNEMCGSVTVISAPVSEEVQEEVEGGLEVEVVGEWGEKDSDGSSECAVEVVGLAQAVKLHAAMSERGQMTASRRAKLDRELGCSDSAVSRWWDIAEVATRRSDGGSSLRSHPIIGLEATFSPTDAQLSVLERHFGAVKRLMPSRKSAIAEEIGVSVAEVALWWATRKTAASAVGQAWSEAESAVLEGAYLRYGRLSPACKKELRAELGARWCDADVKKWFRSRHAQRRVAAAK